jgi:pteridine reductase
MNKKIDPEKVVLISGGAKRIGAATAQYLHAQGLRVAIHYRNSVDEAQALVDTLNAKRPHSACVVAADLSNMDHLTPLIQTVIEQWGRLDVLINNASSFYATPVATASEAEWDDLINSNVKGAFFLSQAAAPYLQKTQGCIINLVDIHADRPLKGYPIYSIAKAGLLMMTKSLARELGPDVRVNAISPGAILWPEQETDAVAHQRIVNNTALKRSGDPTDIAQAVWFFIQHSSYVTGQILAIDGGRTLGNP